MTDKSNPKDLIGAKKVPLSYFPPSAIVAGGSAMAEGAMKYGPYNYREHPVQAMIYVDAALRHILAWLDGEDIDPDSGLEHTWKALACIAILIDTKQTGNLIDNRPKKGNTAEMIKQYKPIEKSKAMPVKSSQNGSDSTASWTVISKEDLNRLKIYGWWPRGIRF